MEENKVFNSGNNKNHSAIFLQTVVFSSVISIAFLIFSLTFFTSKGSIDKLKKTVSKNQKELKTLKSRSDYTTTKGVIDKYINDVLISQILGGTNFPFFGNTSTDKSGVSTYQNPALKFAVQLPTGLALNTALIDYRISQDSKPQGLFMVFSDKLDYALSGNIPSADIPTSLLIRGFIYPSKEKLNEAVESLKKPEEGRSLTLGAGTFGGITYNTILLSTKDKTQTDVEIIYPEYKDTNGVEYFYLFVISGDAEKFKSQIATFKNGLNLTYKPATESTDQTESAPKIEADQG